MSHNVHGHTMPQRQGINEDNPIYGRSQPVYEAPEVAAGLKGAPALRSESESPVGDPVASPIAAAGTVYLDSDGKPVGVSDGEKITPIDLNKEPVQPEKAAVEEEQAPVPDHEDAPENVPDTPEVDTGATDPEATQDE